MAKIDFPTRSANPAKRGLGPDAEAVRLALTDRAEALFRLAWGEPARPGAREWRARATSARSMVMRGAKRGLWRDHASGEGGDALDLFAAHICGLARARDDFPRVLRDAAAFCGMAEDKPLDLATLQARKAAQKAKDERQEAAEASRKAALVRALQARAEPIEGSPAAAYLAGRGIYEPPEGWSFLPPVPDLPVPSPQYPALAAWAVDASGRIIGGQRILIRDDGSKAPENPPKPAFGAIGGYPARIPPRVPGGPICVCEGPETAAAVALATGFEAWAVFGASGFASAPVPAGRQIILCPDRDAPGSSAANAFDAACDNLAAQGADLRIARAPEPEGSKADLADTLAGQGPDAVATAIRRAPKFTRRDGRGRFTGRGAFPTNTPAPLPDFLSPDEARERIRAAVRGFLDGDVVAWAVAGKPEPAPALAIAGSPGTGKSTIAREVLAGFDLTQLGKGDAVYFAPTLALADAAAAHAKALRTGSHVTRGRSATNPETGAKMCQRSELAEKVAKAGLHVQPTLCARKNDNGDKVFCPYFEGCAYQNQWISLAENAPELRLESHAYLSLHDDGAKRDVGLRIMDETVWRQFTKIVDVPLDAWLRPRAPKASDRPAKNWKKEAARLRAWDLANSATAGAADILSALQAGQSPLALQFSAEEFEALAEAERPGTTLADAPSAPDGRLQNALAEHVDRYDGALERAEVWEVLADAKARGLRSTERLRLVRNVKPEGGGEPRDVLRVTRLAEPPRDAPVLMLDADATPGIVQRLYPGARVVAFALRPNARIVQLTDRTFSKAKTLPRKDNPKANRGNRQAIVGLIRAEVHKDTLQGNRGVLAIATKALVRQMFEDAGYSFDGMERREADGIMAGTPLLGARWLWFGPAALGKNDWENFGTAIVIGREEWPLDVLEDMARAFWGDEGEPLQMVEPDAQGRRRLPHVRLPVTMADGSGVEIEAAAHPDPRVRELQEQGRERATRQAVERLRLGTATERKRVVLASAVPVPGLPAGELVSWQELAPNRLQAAMAEAAQRGGVLRLSADGLAADAPETFPTVASAELWWRRGGKTQFNTVAPVIGESITGTTVLNPAKVRLRLEGQRGPKPTTALVVLPGDPRALIEAQLGPLADFEVVDAGSVNAVFAVW